VNQQATAERTTQAPPQEAASKGALSTIAPPRLPYPLAAQQDFGIDQATWRALSDAIFPTAKTPEAIMLALSYCRSRNLDPFKRVVHIVPIYDSVQRREVETVWPGIADHRITAHRTKQFAGQEPTAFGPVVKQTFTGKNHKGENLGATVSFPEWAQITVFRMLGDQRHAYPGPRVYWLETYSKRGRADVPNDRWCRAPSQMLEKCAEAAALRRAFPEEFGDQPVAEEAGIYQRPGNVIEAVAEDAPARPERKDFEKKEPPADEDAFILVDEAGGEIDRFDTADGFAAKLVELGRDKTRGAAILENNKETARAAWEGIEDDGAAEALAALYAKKEPPAPSTTGAGEAAGNGTPPHASSAPAASDAPAKAESDQPSQPQGEGLRAIVMPMKDKKPDVNKYVEAVREELSMCTTEAEVDALMAIEAANLDKIDRGKNGLVMQAAQRKADIAKKAAEGGGT
jgi:phage recombination protein Bet